MHRDGNEVPDDDISVLMESSLKDLESKGWKKSSLGKLNAAASATETTKATSSFHDECKRGVTTSNHRSSRGIHLLPRIRKKTLTVRPNAIQLVFKEVTTYLGDFMQCCATAATVAKSNYKNEDDDSMNDPANQALHCYLDGKIPEGHEFLAFLEQGTPHYQLSHTTNTASTTTTSACKSPAFMVTSPPHQLLFARLLAQQLRFVNQFKKRDVLIFILLLLVVGTVSRDLCNLDLDPRQAQQQSHQPQNLDRRADFVVESKSLNHRPTLPSDPKVTPSPQQGFAHPAVRANERHGTSSSNVPKADSSSPSSLSSLVRTTQFEIAPIAATAETIDASKTATTDNTTDATKTNSAVALDPLSVNESNKEPLLVESSSSSPNSRAERTITSNAQSAFQVWRPRTRKESKQAPGVVVEQAAGEIIPVHPRFRTISRAEYIQALKESAMSDSKTTSERAATTTTATTTHSQRR